MEEQQQQQQEQQQSLSTPIDSNSNSNSNIDLTRMTMIQTDNASEPRGPLERLSNDGDDDDDDGDDDDDDDDDDWSRQVQADPDTETALHRTPSSVLDDHDVLVEVARSAGSTSNTATLATMNQGSLAAAAATTITTTNTTTVGSTVAPPMREEPTLKEKLVERERQRRVETERARLKRQFALRNGGEENTSNSSRLVEEGDGCEEYYEEEGDSRYSGHENMMGEHGSVAGTVGEGSIVEDHHPHHHKHQLNYTMERFLQEQGTITEETTTTTSTTTTTTMREPTSNNTQNQGVVMERFLQEKVRVERSSSLEAGVDYDDHHRHDVDRSVSFDMDPPHLLENDESEPTQKERTTTPPRSVSHTDFDNNDNSTPENNYDANGSTILGINTPREEECSSYFGGTNSSAVSMDCIVTSDVARISDLDSRPDGDGGAMSTPDVNVDGDMIHPLSPLREHEVDVFPPESPSIEQPRVLGLTRAEIEELAAIEEVSQENAPPSERDDLSASSFVAELASDFQGMMMMDHVGGGGGGTTLSQGTPTTAMESASIVSGNQSAHRTESEAADYHQSGDEELENTSVNSNVASDGGGVSGTDNPPSELGPEDTLLYPLAAHVVTNNNNSSRNPLEDSQRPNTSATNESNLRPSISRIMEFHQGGGDGGAPDHHDLSETRNAGIVNRQIRPGMVGAPFPRPHHQVSVRNSSPVRRIKSMPDNMDFDLLEGFDFDKDAPISPATAHFAHYTRDTSLDDLWTTTPGSKMSMSSMEQQHQRPSPFPSRTVEGMQQQRSPSNYGTVARNLNGSNPQHESCLQELLLASPLQPLMPDIPSEIVTNSRSTTTKKLPNIKETANNDDAAAVMAMMHKQDTNDYTLSSLLQKAFPERLLALLATFVVEVPVLLMITRRSDRLCALLGRSTFHLLVALLPLCSAIAGSAGLQTSALTAQNVSNGQITRKNFGIWWFQEIGTAAILALPVGALVGMVAFVLSGCNLLFGLIIMTAQIISILTAGMMGALSPLFISFFLKRSTEKWSGLLETAIQDVISTFVLFVMAYTMLEYCGPFQVDPSDSCYVESG